MMTKFFVNLLGVIVLSGLVMAQTHAAIAVEKKQTAPSAAQKIQPINPVDRCLRLKDRLQCEKCLRALQKKGGMSPLWGNTCGSGV